MHEKILIFFFICSRLAGLGLFKVLLLVMDLRFFYIQWAQSLALLLNEQVSFKRLGGVVFGLVSFFWTMGHKLTLVFKGASLRLPQT